MPSSTVWLYLFFLPFQLIEQLGYLVILAVAIAAFLYLGFLAAGEEIEQPFGKHDVLASFLSPYTCMLHRLRGE